MRILSGKNEPLGVHRSFCEGIHLEAKNDFQEKKLETNVMLPASPCTSHQRTVKLNRGIVGDHSTGKTSGGLTHSFHMRRREHGV